MELMINGETRDFSDDEAATVERLMETLELKSTRGVAVAHNDQVVPRTQWDQVELRPGDRIEVIRATQGG